MSDLNFSDWPYYEPDEIEAVTRVLKSGKVNYWTGQEGRKFEREFAEYHGAEYGVAVANGTVALDLALYALGIGKGDEVVVTPRTFMASVSCIVNAGAKPVFADVDRDSGNITAQSVQAVLTPACRAIMVVHLGGWPCDMNGIVGLAEEKGLFVIEDCAQAHGANVAGQRVGSFGHAAAFSFCTDKIMTTGGEGGMVLTSDPKLWQFMWEYKDHGKSWDAVYNRQHPPGFRWLHESFGTNWRLTEMQSAIGRVQLGKLDQWLEKRRENARMLAEGLSKAPGLRVPVPDDGVRHSYYKFYVYMEPERLKDGWSRDRIMQEVTEKGVPCFQGICPEVYLEKAFGDGRQRKGDGRRRTEDRGRLPVARELGKTSLMFLVHPTLGEREMRETVMVVSEVMKEAGLY
jgi:dTDP-4-amino-4,6-dideoxygalactose transaminase